ncbi:MAG: hypothetical protein Q4D79_05345 [Propionibacteriaceae bacterium]|nr:hypothetical protein [Propionibacteriaceae bacterium]
MVRKLMVGFLAVISVLGVCQVGRSVIPGLRGAETVTAQLGWLRRITPTAAPKMQQFFPEGEFFQWALPGLAAGALVRDGVAVPANLALLEEAIAATGEPQIVNRFGHNDLLPHGTFYHGWRLLLLVDRAALTGDPDHRAEVSAEASLVMTALGEDPLPTSYPGRAWPCDAVAAMAAVHRAARIVDLPGLPELTDRWFQGLEKYRDDAGLLVHQRGENLARGSSQALVQSFLPDIDPERAEREWPVFKARFLSATLGLVGVREYPHGEGGSGDVDSGMLVGGVSLSASAVTLAAARRHGDLELAMVLDRQADLLGLPLPAPHGSAFAFGLMPVGDAFVAWARSAPLGQPLGEPSPQPWWWLFWALALLPVGAAYVTARRPLRLPRVGRRQDPIT